MWVAGSGKELVCWLSLEVLAVRVNRSSQSGPSMEQVAFRLVMGSLWRSSLFKLCSSHPEATGTDV